MSAYLAFTFLLFAAAVAQSQSPSSPVLNDDAELKKEILDFASNIPPVTSECSCVGVIKCPETRPIVSNLLGKVDTSSDLYSTLRNILRSRTCNEVKFGVNCCSKEPLRKPRIYGRNNPCDETDMNASCWKPRSGQGECGRQAAQNFIICPPGQNCDADPGEYTYMALLGYNTNVGGGDVKYLCAGSLINKYWVLTAAHCVRERPIAEVVLGEYNTITDPDTILGQNDIVTGYWPKVQRRKPVKVIRHPFVKDYKETLGYDIALVKLDAPVITLLDDSSYPVVPVCIPWLPDDFGRNLNTDGPAIITGWGKTTNNRFQHRNKTVFCDAGSCKLQELLDLPILNRTACNARFNGQVNLTHRQICAGGLQDGSDTCNGDSGGPLVVSERQTEAKFQIGLVSFGTSQCGIGYPGVYTKIVEYLGWIQEVINTS